ncbi:MAG: DUF3480 domain-containing protein [Cyanobacteria bacterium SZAS LIN-3]|nr:DUF3480 domain-containing protein [Cyanobacteria bacterium SZAS LIN-3]MBS2005995.1 DUF3480 domain-containing protein [Cyanobacteria bacterium SZAS TMP-1]
MKTRNLRIALTSFTIAIAGLYSLSSVQAIPPSTPLLPPSMDVTGAASAELLDTVQAAPDLKVKIYKHTLHMTSKRPVVWSFVTDGLKTNGQQEMVLTVLKRSSESNDAYPRLPIKLFGLIGQLAGQGKLVTTGGYTEFKNQGFLAPQFKGLIYTPVTNLQGVPLPDNCIAVVPVTDDEITVYQTAGPSRLMARLGRDAHFYPCPTWCDRDRSSSFSPGDITEMQEDPVFRSAKAQTFALTAMQDNDQLSLRLTDKTSALLLDLLQQLPSDSALRLALGIDPRADALLVWETKQQDNRSMIAPAGSSYHKIGITFLALLPGLKKNEILTGADGCALMMTAEDFTRFKAALEKKDQFVLPMSDGSALKNFSINWSRE